VNSMPLLEVRDLVKEFPTRAGESKRAVDGVSFSINRGETFGLVGESGSGKSTIGRCILRLVEATSGTTVIDGVDLATLDRREMRQFRSRMQVVFQDPYTSLNRRHSVATLIAAPLRAHGIGNAKERRARVVELLELVQLPASFASRMPRELSGGQSQRVAIARALALNPEFVVLDEAVSALDMSVRAQILNLLGSLQRDLGLTYLFISHDLSVVRYICHTVAVLRNGTVVEQASRDELFEHPRHPYTQQLLAAVPVPDPAIQRSRTKRFGIDLESTGEISEF
jgi:ABC-type oligopeptide transport system ATPase subunit